MRCASCDCLVETEETIDGRTTIRHFCKPTKFATLHEFQSYTYRIRKGNRQLIVLKDFGDIRSGTGEGKKWVVSNEELTEYGRQVDENDNCPIQNNFPRWYLERED